MRLAQGTESAMFAVANAVDKALGFPRAGTHVGRGIHVNMPATWDGSGQTPPGWTREADSVYSVDANTAVYRLEDSVADTVAASPDLTGPEKAAVASSRAGRVDVADYTGRGTQRTRPVAIQSRAAK